MYKGKWVLAGMAGMAVVGLALRVAPVLENGDGNLRHALHWIVYGYDEVWYHNRAYISPGQDTRLHLPAEYGNLSATGEKVMGLPVLATPESKRSSYAPTLLMLQENPKQCIVYELSGGP